MHVPALCSGFFIIIGFTIVQLKGFKIAGFDKFKDSKKNGIKRKYLRLFGLLTILILFIMILVINSIVVKPYLAEIYFYKGRENLRIAQYHDALPNFEYAKKLDPYNGRILHNLGATYYNMGMFEEVKK